MRKRIILFVLPIIALVVMLALFAVTNLTNSYAAGATQHQSKPSHTISAPAASSKGGGIHPNALWSY